MASLIFKVLILVGIIAVEIEGTLSFSTVWYNYKTAREIKGDDLINAAGLPTWLLGSHTCALRLSYALIDSGHTINIGENRFNGATGAKVRASRKGNEKYIVRVHTFRKYLESLAGHAGVVFKNKANYAGKKGIIVFQDCPSFSASGHIDLFDGNDCKDRCYFNECRNIRLFQFKGDVKDEL